MPESPQTSQGNVACAGCTACCRDHSMVELRREWGDKPETYKTHVTNGTLHLATKPNGDCVYLGEKGCTIHDRRPAVCRVFDCRIEWLQTNFLDRHREMQAGIFTAEVFEAGRIRAATLKRPYIGEGEPRSKRHAIMEQMERIVNRRKVW